VGPLAPTTPASDAPKGVGSRRVEIVALAPAQPTLRAGSQDWRRIGHRVPHLPNRARPRFVAGAFAIWALAAHPPGHIRACATLR